MSLRFAPFAFLPTLSQAATPSPAGEALGSLFQLLPSLLLVIVFIFASLWLLKRLTQPRGLAGGLMRVIAAQAVGPRERVIIVEVGTSWLVLGVTSNNVNALAELPRQNLPPPPEAPDFAAWLKMARARRSDTAASGPESGA